MDAVLATLSGWLEIANLCWRTVGVGAVLGIASALIAARERSALLAAGAVGIIALTIVLATGAVALGLDIDGLIAPILTRLLS